MKSNRAIYILLVTGAAAAYVCANRPEPLIFLIILAAAPLVSVLLLYAGTNDAALRAYMRPACSLNQSNELRLTLGRRGRLPIGAAEAVFNFHNMLFWTDREVKVRLIPEEQGEMHFTHTFTADECGRLRVTCDKFAVYDFLGLFKRNFTAGIHEEMTVYPEEITLALSITRKPESKSTGDMYDQQKKGQDVSEVSGLREYVAGDSLRSVHWKLSGKLNKMIVREFGFPSNYNTLLLYDLMLKCGGSTISVSRCNAVLSLASAMSRSMIQMGMEHNVGRVAAGELNSVPVNSMDDYDQMQLNLLTALPVPEDSNPAETVFSLMQGNMKNEFTKIIYITPVYDEASAKQLADNTDLTIIAVGDGGLPGYVSTEEYDVINIGADTLHTEVQTITI